MARRAVPSTANPKSNQQNTNLSLKMTTVNKPPVFKRLEKELEEIAKVAAPFVQVQQSIFYENGDESTTPIGRWHAKIMTNTIFDKDNIVELDIQFHGYPFTQPIANFIQKPPKPSSNDDVETENQSQQQEVVLVPVPLAHLYQFSESMSWNPTRKMSTILIELNALLCGPVVTTVVHGHLMRQFIPVELRSLVMNYLIAFPTVTFINTNIHYAVWLWTHHRELAMLRYGHISQWDTSRVTDMSKLFHELPEFNDDISRWNVSQVSEMKGMFKDAHSFNQPLDSWDVSNVRDMTGMFAHARSFNQPHCAWTTDTNVRCRCCFGGIVVENTETPRPMYITIRSPYSDSYVYCYVFATDTISIVLQKHQMKLKCPPFETRVIYCGKALDNDMTLEECGVYPEATLTCVRITRFNLEEHINILEKILRYEYNTHLSLM